MKPQKTKSDPSTPWWMYVVVIALGAGVGLLARPLLQGKSIGDLFGAAGGGTPALSTTPKVHCVNPAGGELALEEFVDPASAGVAGTGIAQAGQFSHRYRLERPGQPALSFAGITDANTFNLRCDNVRFGPGPRVSFGRGQEAMVIELVGEAVRNFDANNNPDLASLVVEPRWKLGLKLEEYAARAPEIAEDGKAGKLTLERRSGKPGLPDRLLLETKDGGQTFKLNRALSLAGL